MKKAKDSIRVLKIEKFEVARFQNTSKIVGGNPPPDDHTLDPASTRQCRNGQT